MRKSDTRNTKTVGAPPRSLYRKIQIVLDEARKGQSGSFEALVDHIDRRGHLDFTHFHVTPDHSTAPVPCSEKSIAAVVQLCSALGLVDKSNGKLTRSGMRATDSRHFDEVIRKSLAGALEQLGTPLQEVKKVIVELLINHEINSLPTWDVIYDRLGSPGGNTDRDKFRTYLSLLSACQGIAYSRKKIYLP